MGKTQFSVRDAANQAGVSRQTMFRYIKDGKISATTDRDGQKQIELSELLRVFGELQQPVTKTATVTDNLRVSRTSAATSKDSVLIQVEFARLQAQLEIKTAELALARERINELKAREHTSGEEKNRLMTLIEQQSRLLAAPTPTPAPPRAARSKPAARSTPAAPLKTKATKTSQPSKAAKPAQPTKATKPTRPAQKATAIKTPAKKVTAKKR